VRPFNPGSPEKWPLTQVCCVQALQTATLNDRIHLRTTNYNYAKFLESRGQITEAIK